MSEVRRVIMACEDEETRRDVSDMLRRVSSSMSAVESFVDKLTELDEDAPDDEEKAWALMERMLKTLVSIYPHGPAQMQEDIKSIGDFSVYAPPARKG